MTDYTGKDLYLTWIYPSGTVVLNTDYRTVGTAEQIDTVDVAAGSDTDRTYLTRIKDGTISYAGLHQTAGTALKQALEAGNSGTLILSPEGTASTNPKETYLAISMGAQMNYAYADAVEITCEFQKNGARADSVWA